MSNTLAPLWRTRAAPEPTWLRSWGVKIMRLRSHTPMPASPRAEPIAPVSPGNPASTRVLPFSLSRIKVRFRRPSAAREPLGMGRT